MGAFLMIPIKAFVNGAKNFAENGIKNGADEVIKNGAKNGAKNGIKNGKPPARILNKADYEGNAGGHSGFGRFKADMAVVTDQRKGLQKPQFRDQNGDLNYHQFNGKGKNSQFIHRDKKNGRKLARNEDAAFQTKPEVNKKKEFYKNREQELDSEVHHVAPIKALKFLFDGLSEKNRIKLINYFEKKGYYIGNDPRNGVGVNKEQHKQIHNVLYKENGLFPNNRKSLEGLSLEERLDFADAIMDEIEQAKKFEISPGVTLQGLMEYNSSSFGDSVRAAHDV